MNRKRGYTLVEMSIVLVIIGLVVGGVMVGNDLVNASRIRSTISQKESFDGAVHAFKNKFNGLPGDLSNYAMFSGLLTTTGLTGQADFGDGDGLIGSRILSNYYGERMLFWRHLTEAGYIEANTSLATIADPWTAVKAFSGAGYVPSSKFGRDASWLINGNPNSRQNYYTLVKIMALNLGGAFATFGAHVITPSEAFQIDTKMDDGFPASGKVLSVAIAQYGNAPNNGVSGGTGTSCYDSDTGMYLLANPDAANARRCTLVFMAPF